jgi:hypothetical protein
MLFPRLRFAAALCAALLSLVATASAQPYGGPPPQAFAPPGPGGPRPGYGPPIMQAPNWKTVESAGGQTWDGNWTWDRDHHSMSGSWVNRTTGQRVYAQRMFVHMNGGQVAITRPGTGTYSGVVSQNGRAIRGSMSWIQGHFTARM